MSPNCTHTSCTSPCEFPYVYDNATNGCASAAALLGDAFAAYNLAYIWAAALLLFGFLRSWLFNLRELNWHLSGRPSVLIPLLCTIAQVLSMIEASNLHSLRWPTRVWASLGCDLFGPCTFSALLVCVDQLEHHARSRSLVHARSSSALHSPKSPAKRGIVRRLYNALGHAVPWAIGLVISGINATTPASLAEGASYVYIIPFILVLVAFAMKSAWTDPSLRRRVLGLCSMLGLVAVYLTLRGASLLLSNDGQSPRPTSPTFPLESVPVPVVKVVGSTLAMFHYGRPRSDTSACWKSRFVDPLTLIAAHVAVLSGLMSTGFVVATAEAMETVFFITVTVVPALFVAGLGAQLLRAGPLLERHDDDTAALIARCEADFTRARSIPVAVKQFCSGSFLVSLSLKIGPKKMGPARQNLNDSSAAFHTLTGLVEVENLFAWTRGHQFDLSIIVLATYAILFGSFILLRLWPVPRWLLATMFALWAFVYDLFLISAMRFVMKGLKCDGGDLVMNRLVRPRLGPSRDLMGRLHDVSPRIITSHPNRPSPPQAETMHLRRDFRTLLQN